VQQVTRREWGKSSLPRELIIYRRVEAKKALRIRRPSTRTSGKRKLFYAFALPLVAHFRSRSAAVAFYGN
jgi:hypothetical protein